jgi:BirA family transcriptional regulator, biotin operon repressor / biotin---[acetyl-CoA-carboxylase] ligase
MNKSIIPSPLIYFDSIDSTNKYALANLEKLEDGTLIVAGEQTGGRGRNNNNWHSPKTNVYASYVIKPKTQILLQTSWIGGLAALKTLKDITNLKNLWIKWPNDIFCNNSKICGVLCESRLSSQNTNHSSTGIVIGIGINTNCNKQDLKDIPKACTSAYIETGILFNLNELYKTLHQNLNSYYLQIMTNGIDPLYEEWKAENKLLGRTITVEHAPDNIVEIKVLDINKNGAIIGTDNKGEIKTIYSGDVLLSKVKCNCLIKYNFYDE